MATLKNAKIMTLTETDAKREDYKCYIPAMLLLGV